MNIMTWVKKFNRFLLPGLLVICLLLNIIPAATALAANSPSITVGPDIVSNDTLMPGSFYAQPLTVSSIEPVTISIAGLGQTVGGAPIAVPPASDTSPFTARSWISVDKTTLPAGNNQSVTFTINVPTGTAAGQDYAAILVQSSDGTFSVLVPVLLTVDKTHFTANAAGQISNVSVPQVYQSKPLDVLTNFSNTGNCLITNANISVVVTNSSGATVWQSNATINAPSIMPSYPRAIDNNKSDGLLAGNYTVTSTITLANGPVYHNTANFTVLAPIPPPPAPVLTSPGGSAAPGPVINTFTPTFQWNASTNAAYYELDISLAPGGQAGTPIFTQQNLTSPSFTLPSGIIWGGQYYSWTVTASNIYGTSISTPEYFQTYGTSIRINTTSATNITTTGATLNANLLSMGTDSSEAVNFEYGTTTGYGSTTTAHTQTATGAVSFALTGLTPNTTYHFQAQAVGSSEAWGGDVTFMTSNPAPTITNITPASAGVGATETISGTNFIAGTIVTFNGTASTNVTIVNATTLKATVPNLGTNNINNVTVVVKNTSGSATSVSFNYVAPSQAPKITGFSPVSATAGDNVTITGSNFNGVNSVSFGGVPAASYNVTSVTQIIAVVGNGNSGAISVTTANGAATVNGFVFVPPSTTTNTTSTATTPTQTATTTTQTTTSGVTATTTTQTTVPPTSTTTTAISRSYAGYFPPEIDESSLTYQDFTNDADSDFNAAAQTGAEVSLTGTNKNGTIIIVQYLSAPQTVTQFSAGGIKGGTGKSAIKFVGVRVEGATAGTAHVTVVYNDNDVSAYNVNSLILAYFSGGSWHNAGNIKISSANDTISGDIPVSRLSGTAIGLGGDRTQAAGGIPNNNQGNNTGSTPGFSWAMVGIIMVSIFIVGTVIFVIERNRRKTQTNK